MATLERLLDDMDAVIFEADTARQWMTELAERAQKMLDRAENAGLRAPDYKEEVKELHQAKAALTKARGSLRIFEGMVARRESAGEEVTDES